MATGDDLDALVRVYGPETWDVYELLDRSLHPRGPESMLALAVERLGPGSTVLDVGCRDATHLVELVRATGARGVGLEPVTHLVASARAVATAAGLEDRIRIEEGRVEAIPEPDEAFDLVWCRDVLELVRDLDAALREIARVLRPGGYVLVFTVLATELLGPPDAAILARSLAVVPESLERVRVERAFTAAGLQVDVADALGTEWREHAEERSQPVSRDLLRLARLRRRRHELVERHGAEIVGHVEANLHWSAFQFLGKLAPTLFALRKPR
jgi:ubiquinone/menaquinone biosynthesis C-methylase UbiE